MELIKATASSDPLTALKAGFFGLTPVVSGSYEFAKRWMFKSERGAETVLAVVAVDALGLDPLAVDRARAEASELWGPMYGATPTRARRSARRTMLQDLRRQGWRQVNDEAKLDKATVWVKVHHVYGGASAYLQDTGGEVSPFYDDLARLSHYLQEVDEALERPRKRGRPRQMSV